MPKRKAASHNEQAGPSSSKKLRTEDAAAAAAAVPDATDSGDSSGGALTHADRAQRIATQTLKLVDAVKKTDSSYAQRMQTVVDLLQEDAARTESLLNLSLVPEDNASCVLFRLLAFFCTCCEEYADTGAVKADKYAAQRLIYDEILPLKKWLLRSFDPTTIDTTTGNNALHELGRLISLDNVRSWDCKLARLLIARGVSVHARNKKGLTPLLQLAATHPACVRSADGADGMRLLLQHGADVNAQDHDGNGVLHHLILCDAAEVRLADLLDGDGVAHLDHTLCNDDGETAADLAAIRVAELQASWEEEMEGYEEDEEDAQLWQGELLEEFLEEERRAIQIEQLIDAQTAKWINSVRPELLLCLESVLPVADLAKLTLGYVDGSGHPFATADESKPDDDIDEPAAPAAASQS